VDKIEQLGVLVTSLSSAPHVFGRAGQIPEGGAIATEIYSVVLTAQDAWQHEADPRTEGPRSGSDIAEVLRTMTEAVGVELLVDLSVDNLVSPGHLHGDREDARHAAQRVASLLGNDTTWRANTQLVPNGRAWSPVTRNTFDGVVAAVGTDGTFVVLLQVGED
jgi:hypothetical protein